MNLDAMGHDDLVLFWKTYRHPSRAKARELVGAAVKSPVKACQTLACYAMNKACAMGLRLEGKIQQALVYEEAADLAYGRLPEGLRW